MSVSVPSKFARERKVANQRADWTHKVASQIISSNSLVATEKLNLKGMTRKANKRCDPGDSQSPREARTPVLGSPQVEEVRKRRAPRQGSKLKRQKTGLNRNLLDVAIGMLREFIKYKVIEAGGVFLEAPTQKLKPTQRCNNCWELTPKTLSDRLHVCSHCCHSEDRDINSAQVCLTWARGLERASSDADSFSSTSKNTKYCGSMKQLGKLKRQKRLSSA